MGQSLKKVNLVEWKGMGDRIIKKVAERNVDTGHVEQQEHHRNAGQRDTEIPGIKTHGRTHWKATERQSDASIKPSMRGACKACAETNSEAP
ncbi:hypothetical protein D9M68_979330 [compost metagenome]